ncbi:MAG: winged helix-turn-helix transcriptional regulator [Limnochordaceae bacterium]|nr:winged helix-turn-helix transcriptional regulator [Limnochordaceae bacterium]
MSLVFKALSDPTRRQILRMLSQGDLSAGEIASAFRMAKPSISHHLSVLKQAGLVQDERRGQQIIYSLDTTVFQEVLSWIFDVAQRPVQNTRGGEKEADQGERRGADPTTPSGS